MNNLFKSVFVILILLSGLNLRADTFKVDSSKSQLNWSGSKVLVKTKHHGQMSIKEGQLEIKAGKLIAGQILVDMNSLTNEDLKDSPEYQQKLTKHLKSDDFFNAEKFPVSTLKITQVTTKSATDVLIKADLTIRDQTQSIEFPATVKIDKNQAFGEANLKLDRTLWNLKYGSGKFFKDLGDKVIADEFEIAIKIEAKK